MGIFGLFKPDVKKLKETKDVIGLIKLLHPRKDPDLRKEVIWALAELGDERAVQPLIECLDDSNFYTIRRFAALAIGHIKNNYNAVMPLINCLKSRDVWWSAIESLLNIGKPAFEHLISSISDNDPETCAKLIYILKKLDENKTEKIKETVASCPIRVVERWVYIREINKSVKGCAFIPDIEPVKTDFRYTLEKAYMSKDVAML